MMGVLRAGLLRLAAWRGQSVNRSILAAAITVGGATAFVKLVATVKELLVARQFGTTDALDAYLIAFVLPSFFINVLGGSLSSALIPTFIAVRSHHGEASAQRLFSSTTIAGIGIFASVSVLLALAGPYALPLLASGFGRQKLMLTRALFFFMIPTLIFSGVARTWSGVLNADKRFALAAASPVIMPAVTIAALLLVGEALGIYALALGTVAGFLLEAFLLAWGLRRIGVRLKPRWHGFDPPMRKIVEQYFPMLAGAVLMSSTTLVDQAMAAMLGGGSVSALNYGNKIVAVILGLSSMPLATVILPHFSQMVANGEWRRIRLTLRTYSRAAVAATVPLVVVLILFSKPLIRMLFERGTFTASDTAIVADVLACYTLQLPFFVVGMLMVRLVSALRANEILFWGSGLNLVLNVVLNYVFMQYWGVAGIALSTAVVYFASFCYLKAALAIRFPSDAQ